MKCTECGEFMSHWADRWRCAFCGYVIFTDETSIKKQIIRWWNTNGFLGYTVKTIADIREAIKISQFGNIEDMVDFYINSLKYEEGVILYSDDIKNHGLKNIKFIQEMLAKLIYQQLGGCPHTWINVNFCNDKLCRKRLGKEWKCYVEMAKAYIKKGEKIET